MSSRITKKPVIIPDGIVFEEQEGHLLFKRKDGKNFLGVKSQEVAVKVLLHPSVAWRAEDEGIFVEPTNDTREALALSGTIKSLIRNAVIGLTEGYKRQLKVYGVGYRAQAAGDELVLVLGYSHDVRYAIPSNVKITTPDNTSIEVEGYDKQAVGQVVAHLHDFKRPDAYKGKGVRIVGKNLRLKEVKK